MPKVSQEELAARRGAILAAARRAFARHGYEGATVKVLEAETGLSRGAIFHHFRDKEALFLALAEDDAAAYGRGGRDRGPRAGHARPARQGRRLARACSSRCAAGCAPTRSSPPRWAERQEAITRATAERLERQRAAGVRCAPTCPPPLLVDFLRLVFDGLVSGIASGMPLEHLDGVLDLVESAVRTPTSVTRID